MKTQCPNCKAKFNVNDKFAGKTAKCPKCAKPFTIEPFIETPAAVEPPAKSPPLAGPRPLAGPEPVAPPAKRAEPVTPPAQSVAPAAPPAKIAVPAAPPAKSPGPIETPVRKLTTEHPSTPLRTGEGKKTETTSADSAPSAVKPVLSKTLFVYCWSAVRIIAGTLALLGLALAIRKGANPTLTAIFAAADVFLVCSVLIELALYYRMWAAIQNGQASISPAKAIGFLFIPVFNIYWALYMFTGFAEDYNALIQRRSVKTGGLSFTLFLIHAVVFLLSAMTITTPLICVVAFVRYIGKAFMYYPYFLWPLVFFALAAGIAHFITYILLATKTCNAINALPRKKDR